MFGSIFGGGNNNSSQQSATPTQQQQQQQTQSNQQTQQQQPSDTQQQQQQQQVDPTSLEAFSNIWNKPQGQDQNQENQERLLDLDPAQLQQQISQLNFAGQIPADVMEKVSAGGPEGTQAMLQIVNQIGQRAFGLATMQSANQIEQALARLMPQLEKRIEGQIRSQQTATSVLEADPRFSNPAVRPIVDMARRQLEQQFPNDTPSQIREKLNNYFQAFSKEFQPKQEAASTGANGGPTDFSKFFN